MSPRKPRPERPLHFLWHPGIRDRFSGYGLMQAPWRLVGLIMVDRPQVADPAWLAEIERTFGSYQLAPMTQMGERGIVCQMEITEDSRLYLRRLVHPLSRAIGHALRPLLRQPPAVRLEVRWQVERQCWTSAIVRPPEPRFSLGQIVMTPGAVRALAAAGQHPMEFIARHQAGDWGELDEEDQRGYRILSAYRTHAGVPLWVITEADRSATTILLPEEY